MDVPAIDVHELAGLEATVVDVREPHEYDEAHVPGAMLVPLAEVPERVEELPEDRPLYVICGSGPRSARAVEFLLRQGIDAVNVAGGTRAWIEAGYPVAAGSAPG